MEQLETPIEDVEASAAAPQEPLGADEVSSDAAPEPTASDLAPITVAAAPQRKAATWVAVAALAVFALLTATATVGDYVLLALVPNGVSVVGRQLSGMDAADLRATIEESVAGPAMRPLTVSGDGRSWRLDPAGIVSVDVDAMVDEAYAPARNATIVTRLWSRLSGEPMTADVKPVYTVDRAALAQWVARTAADVDRAPVDATRTVVKYTIKITPEVMGATVDQARAVDEIAAALTADTAHLPASRIAYLPVVTVKPKVTKASFKKAIVVSLSRCKVYLFDGDKLVKTYRCAPGQPAWPTPQGDFVVIRKQANAPWINPGSAWAESMPPSIPGGPYNPMGDRKIGINSPGIFLHGIPPSEYSSIGTHASHGCMRMMPSDIHDLYPRVRIGNPVYIRS